MLDGHIILSRALGAAGHYPAIDVLHSVSRLTTQIANNEQLASMRKLREALSSYQQAEDLIQLGAYVSGTNPKLDAVLRMRPELLRFLQQDSCAEAKWDETLAGMRQLASLVP
jgi:flagellar biosynthesis/type III secretory pathway ATPase